MLYAEFSLNADINFLYFVTELSPIRSLHNSLCVKYILFMHGHMYMYMDRKQVLLWGRAEDPVTKYYQFVLLRLPNDLGTVH